MKTARGQMILIAAVVVAVTILGSVVLLNVLHVPADINTQQDARSLESVESTTEQVTRDLERLFLTHTSVNKTGEQVPYANVTDSPGLPFDSVVGNYSNVSADLTASDASRIVSVVYLSGGSQSGLFLRHNDSTKELTYHGFNQDDPDWQVLDAETMPYFHLNVTGANESDGGIADGEPFEVDLYGEQVTFYEDEVLHDGDLLLEGSDHADLYPVEMELVNGSGEVRNGSARTSLQFDSTQRPDLKFGNGNETNGTFTVSGTGSPYSDLVDDEYDNHQYTLDDVVVNPKFRINVTDASVTHSTTFALYNGTQP